MKRSLGPPGSEGGTVFWLTPEGASRNVSEQRYVDVLRHPLVPDGPSPEHDSAAPRAVVRCAVLGVAGGLVGRHADRHQTVAGDDGA